MFFRRLAWHAAAGLFCFALALFFSSNAFSQTRDVGRSARPDEYYDYSVDRRGTVEVPSKISDVVPLPEKKVPDNLLKERSLFPPRGYTVGTIVDLCDDLKASKFHRSVFVQRTTGRKLILLPCHPLEVLEDSLDRMSDRGRHGIVTVKVLGEITTYRGRNYLRLFSFSIPSHQRLPANKRPDLGLLGDLQRRSLERQRAERLNEAKKKKKESNPGNAPKQNAPQKASHDK